MFGRLVDDRLGLVERYPLLDVGLRRRREVLRVHFKGRRSVVRHAFGSRSLGRDREALHANLCRSVRHVRGLRFDGVRDLAAADRAVTQRSHLLAGPRVGFCRKPRVVPRRDARLGRKRVVLLVVIILTMVMVVEVVVLEVL